MALVMLALVGLPHLALAAPRPRPTISTTPGTVVRWSVPGTKRCGMAGRSWPPLGETCYYPIDLLKKPGVVEIVRRGDGTRESARVKIVEHVYPTEELDLGDIHRSQVQAVVITGANVSLLGQPFLENIDEIVIRKGEMVLRDQKDS